jgi:hypothetical protein
VKIGGVNVILYLKGVSELLPYFFFYISRPIWMKFGTEYVCRSVWKCVRWKTLFTYRRSKWVVLLFAHLLSDLGAFGMRVLQSSWALFSVSSVKTITGKAPAFPTDVSGTHIRVCAVEQRYFDSKERLGDVCSSSRREQSRSLVKFF